MVTRLRFTRFLKSARPPTATWCVKPLAVRGPRDRLTNRQAHLLERIGGRTLCILHAAYNTRAEKGPSRTGGRGSSLGVISQGGYGYRISHRASEKVLSKRNRNAPPSYHTRPRSSSSLFAFSLFSLAVPSLVNHNRQQQSLNTKPPPLLPLSLSSVILLRPPDRSTAYTTPASPYQFSSGVLLLF